MTYLCGKMMNMQAEDPLVMYNAISDGNVNQLIALSRSGIAYRMFSNLVSRSPFNLSEWSGFLHISDRTMQRYKKEEKAFDPPQSEKIIEIALLFNRGREVFGSPEKFNLWVDSDSIALGGIKPKSLLDSTFGIGILNDELSRIEQGILP